MADRGITHLGVLDSRLVGRQHAVRALGALGLGLLTSLGLQAPASAKSKTKRRVKRRSVGHSGPSGPQGPAGAIGATGPDYVQVLVSGQKSAGLAVAAGSSVQSTITCGNGKVLSCGYNVAATTAQLVNVVVKGVGADSGLGTCGADLIRTSDVGSTAGAAIIAYAICKP